MGSNHPFDVESDHSFEYGADLWPQSALCEALSKGNIQGLAKSMLAGADPAGKGVVAGLGEKSAAKWVLMGSQACGQAWLEACCSRGEPGQAAISEYVVEGLALGISRSWARQTLWWMARGRGDAGLVGRHGLGVH